MAGEKLKKVTIKYNHKFSHTINNFEIIRNLAKLIRYYILVSTTESGSGHPTSSLSATDLMAALFFGGYLRFDLENPKYPNNDRIIFSKGHASPLFYALYAAAGKITQKELMSLRKMNSPLEGHPTMGFPYTEAATGSLGQGLSIGLGMALNAKYIDKLSYKTFVLLGDSEMAEGSQWEALQVAAHYKLGNLIAILDVNRLGQRGETMYGHDVSAYVNRISAFGWKTIEVDGHSIDEITDAYNNIISSKNVPSMIIAKTIKGKGVSFLEDQDGWHGKCLKKEDLKKAVDELGEIDDSIIGIVKKPENLKPKTVLPRNVKNSIYQMGQPIATRKAYGNALTRIFPKFPKIAVLDAEVSNSTYSGIFKDAFPKRFFEMYIAEQNMVGTALGLSQRGKIPFVSTFAAFFSRAFDQIRMSSYSNANIKFVGSHAGVAIGEDGSSQMGLEDISMFRTLLNSVVFYPADATATEKLVEAAAEHFGIVYIRTSRNDTRVIYENNEKFTIGGSKILRRSKKDLVTIVAAGITLYEALKAYEMLKEKGILIRVIDLYCIKPVDKYTLLKAVKDTKAIIVVEDHYSEGGMAEAVSSGISGIGAKVFSLAVRKMPKSGKPSELLNYEEIDSKAIEKKVMSVFRN